MQEIAKSASTTRMGFGQIYSCCDVVIFLAVALFFGAQMQANNIYFQVYLKLYTRYSSRCRLHRVFLLSSKGALSTRRRFGSDLFLLALCDMTVASDQLSLGNAHSRRSQKVTYLSHKIGGKSNQAVSHCPFLSLLQVLFG